MYFQSYLLNRKFKCYEGFSFFDLEYILHFFVSFVCLFLLCLFIHVFLLSYYNTSSDWEKWVDDWAKRPSNWERMDAQKEKYKCENEHCE